MLNNSESFHEEAFDLMTVIQRSFW